MTPDPAPPLARRLLAVAVGLFALWQMLFLVAANVLNLVPVRSDDPEDLPYKALREPGTFTSFEPLQRTADTLNAALDAYAEATGQEQQWSLFAPGFPPHSLFTAVELTFADGTTAEVRSDYEPLDHNNAPLRAPFVSTRRYNVEIQFTPAVLQHTEEAFADAELAPIVRAQTFGYFRHTQPALLTWVRWQTAEYQNRHPERGAPVQVVYQARYVPTPLPGEPKVWSKPVRVRPLVRWFPGRTPAADELPLQVFDAAAARWVTLVRNGGER